MAGRPAKDWLMTDGQSIFSDRSDERSRPDRRTLMLTALSVIENECQLQDDDASEAFPLP